MAEQKLGLVEISSGIAAQPSARPAEVMRSPIFNGCSLRAVLYDMPDDALSYAFSPGLACSANAPKDTAFAHASARKPRVLKDAVLTWISNGLANDAQPIRQSTVALPPGRIVADAEIEC